MITEALTLMFAGLTGGYLAARERHNRKSIKHLTERVQEINGYIEKKKEEEEGGRVQPPTGVASHPDHWWQRFPISEEIRKAAVKLPSNKKEWDSAALHKIYPPPEKIKEISSKLADLDRHLQQLEASHKELGEREKMREEQYKKAYLQYISTNIAANKQK